MTGLTPGRVTDAAALAVAHEAVPAHQVVEGSPTTGYAELEAGMGVWEITPGTVRDTEVDEIFVVLSGSATVEFHDPELPSIELGPGSTVRLTEGMRTVWIVRETLRKIFIPR